MMTLKLFEFLTYICSGMICLTLGVVLVGVRNDSAESAIGFRRVKVFVGIASFLDVLVDVLVVILWYQRADYMLVNSFFCPLILFFQLYMAVASLLHLFRFPNIDKKMRRRFETPVIGLAVMHYGIFAYRSAAYGLTYSEFVHSPFGEATTILLYAFIFMEIIVLSIWMIKGTRRYNAVLSEYYSGIDVIRGRRLTSVLYAFFLYVLLAGMNVLSGSALVSAVMIWVTTILFVVFAISLINLQRLFSLVSPAFAFQEREKPSSEENSDMDMVTDALTGRVMTAGQFAVDEAVKKWIARDDKPYLSGVTLADAADAMGVGHRILSDFLNNVHGLNFNAWINGLRIDEVVRIMKENPGATLPEIADKTGFSDSSALSRTFKKVMGTTVSQYRSGIS